MLGPDTQKRYEGIINRVIDAPRKGISEYAPTPPSLKAKYIQDLCFELLDELHRDGAEIPSHAIFFAETYASGLEEYAQVFASVLVTTANGLDRGK